MIRFFVDRPVTTIMFIAVFVVLGVFSFMNLNIEEKPKIDFPIVSIETLYPGATPYEVETQIVNKIEDAIAEIAEIKKIESNAYEGFGLIMIEFLLSADVNVKSIEVKDKVEGILNDLPEGAKKPIIKKFDPLIEPILNLILYSDTQTERDLYEYADKKFKNILSRIKGVATIDIFGGQQRQINIKLDPFLMKQYYVTIDDVEKKLNTYNRNVPGGTIDKNDNSFSVRFQGEFNNIDDIANMLIQSQDGQNFTLKDIAKIEDSYKKIDTMARFNNHNVVNLSIKKVSDGNAVNIAKTIIKKLPTFQKIMPKGMHVEIASDSTKFIVNETKDAELSIFIGILLTAIILYLFTGHINLTFISSLAIPTSIISTFFLMDQFGFTLNMMTLLAMATALGTLIANAIVIIEHVLERLEAKDSAYEAAIAGTSRCAFALIASTGTNLVVFTPIAFMGGIVGQFMKSFGLTVVFATIFSLVASFSLTPMLCAVLLKNLNVHKQQKRWGLNPLRWLITLTNICVEWFKKEYLILFRGMFKLPKTTLILVFLSLWALKFITPYIGNEFYPTSDQDIVFINITMPQGSTIERTSNVVSLIEKKIKDIAEIESYLSSIGENGVENATVTLNLISLKKRTRSDSDIINSLIPFTSQIPGADIEYKRGSGGPGNADMVLNLYGKNYETMSDLSGQMQDMMEKSGYFRSVISSYKYPKTEVQFIPNQEKMTQYGLNNKVVGEILRMSIYGNDANIYKEDGEEYKINIELDKQHKNSILDIFEINVISRKGLIPITQLGDIVIHKAIPAIKHRDKERIIQLQGYLSKSTAGFVQNYLDKLFQQIKFEEGYGYRYGGNTEHQEESNKELGKAFLIAVILTFMLLAAILNSVLYPLAIVSTVVTSFVGVFLFLFFTDKSINIAAMLGIIMLVGLVVNNAILVIEYAIYKLNQGVEIKDAIEEAMINKLRPMLLTTLAIIFGTAPQLWSIVPIKNSMAAVIIGGMIASTFFTFTCVPVLFWYLERFRRFMFKITTKKTDH